MKAKYKMTGCARALIFLIIIAPVAYFGAKYLRDSGTWDKITNQTETTTRDVEYGNNREPMDLPPAGASISQDQFDRLRKEYEEQELIIARQDRKIKDLEQENAQLRKRGNNAGASIPPTTQQAPAQNPPRTNNTGSPSIDDLLREADSNLGTSSQSSNTARKTYGQWSFTYAGNRGTIEVYEKNGKYYSQTRVQGDSRLDIDELQVSGNNFVVRGSQSGEYYKVLRNGDLEAYDRNGYQTTCKRM